MARREKQIAGSIPLSTLRAKIDYGFVEAMTLGFSILGRSAESLDRCRQHEMVHVRQYAIWGPLFGPAYLLCSLYLWIRGRDAYRENPFEVQAYAVDDCRDHGHAPDVK